MWARVVAAAVLLGGGIWIGAELQGSGARAAGAGPRGAAGNSATATRAYREQQHREQHDKRHRPRPGGIPAAVHAPPAGTTPELCVSQPYGDGDTVYIIHGTGFRPFTPVTVQARRRRGVSPDHPVTDLQGTFNYAIDQGHRFFSGPIPPGDYKVVVTASGGPAPAPRSRSTRRRTAAAARPAARPGQPRP